MFGNILQRAIFWELLRAFMLALVALTGILLLAGIVAEASQRGLSPGQILAAIPLIVPSLMPYTIPSTTLFATCLVYGRLAHDNEITAVKAAGINLLAVIWPSAVLGVLTTLVTLVLYYQVIPNTQYILRAQFLADVEEFLYSMLKNERSINHPRLSYAIWVRQVQDRRLLGATFKRRDAHGNYDLVAVAREAELWVDSRRNEVQVRMKHGEVYSIPNGTRAYFDERVWPVPMDESPLNQVKERKPREMTLAMLQQGRLEVLAKIDETTMEIAKAIAQLALGVPVDAPTLPRHRMNLEEKRQQLYRELLAIRMELYMRPAIAFGCFCFVMVGCPVGIWFSKRDYLSAFITCFLPIVFIYYPLLLCGINLSRNGRAHPLITLWACNALMLVLSFALLRRLIKH